MLSFSFRRSLAGLVFLFLLGGCKSRVAPPVAVASLPRPARPKPTATPRPTPKPLPAWRKHPHIVYGVQTRQRVVALTFDDGPDPTWTPKVLAILKRTQTPATFFMVGKMVRAHPQFAHMVKDAHFPIGNHSWSHPSRPRNPRAEVEQTDAILQKVLHLKPTLFRPPYGLMSNGLVKIALSRGEDAILWDSLGADWNKQVSAASIEAKVVHGARAGSITLLHDGGGNRARTVAALPRIISRLRARGFRFVTVPELLLMGPPIHVGRARAPRSKKPLRHPKRAKRRLQAPRPRATPRATPRAKPVLQPAATPQPKLAPWRRAAPKREARTTSVPRRIPTPKPLATAKPKPKPGATRKPTPRRTSTPRASTR